MSNFTEIKSRLNGPLRISQTILLAVCIVVSVCAGFFVFYPIADGDIFWHLAAGKEIFLQKSLLFTDPFSYTTPGIRWIDLHWIFQILSYTIYLASGYYGILIFKSFVVMTAVFFVLHPLKTYLSGFLISVFFLYVVFQFRYLVPMRPGIMTLLYMSLFIRFLEHYVNTNKLIYLVILIPLQVLWVNTQGLFLIGPSIYAAYIVGFLSSNLWSRYVKKEGLVTHRTTKSTVLFISAFVLVCLSSMINPYGISGFLFPLKLLLRITPGEMNQFSNTIVENMPLLTMIGTEYSFYVNTFLIVCGVALLSAFFSSRKMEWIHIYLFAGFMVLAFMAQRNLILFAFAVIPGVKKSLEQIRYKNLSITVRLVFNCVGGILLVFICYGFTAHWKLLSSVGGPIAPFCHPIKSVEYLKRYSVSGNVFNADRYGGYLLWETYPKFPVYIDTRLTMRDQRFFSDYLALLDKPDRFKETVIKYNVSTIMLPSSLPRYYRLVKSLYDDPKWSVVVADGSECLFVKEEISQGNQIKFDAVGINKAIQAIRNDPILKTTALKTEAVHRYGNFLNLLGIGYSAGP